MKICVFLLLSLLCFLNCSNQGSDSETSVNNALPGQTSNVVTNENRANTGNALKSQTRSFKTLGNFGVDTFIDNELVSRSTYRDGLCVRYITFNTQTKKQEGDIEYFYKKGGELDHIKVIQGDKSGEAQLEAEKSNQDFLFQYSILRSKGIEFPLPDIAEDEVGDLSTIFSIPDNYSDFKTETKNNGKLRTISFLNFNKKIRFNHSAIPYLIGLSEEVINDTLHIKEYKLTLDNRLPLKEIYTTGNGELTKTYSYNDGKLIRIFYRFTDIENRTKSLDKRFEYHELR